MDEFYKFVASMPFPKGNKKALTAAGELSLSSSQTAVLTLAT